MHAEQELSEVIDRAKTLCKSGLKIASCEEIGKKAHPAL